MINDLWERKWLFRLTVALALVLWLITLLLTELGHPEPSPYWYARSLYWTFWPGLLFSLLAVLLSMKHGTKDQIISLLLPVIFLYSLPSLLHDMPTVFDIYHVIPSVMSITETGSVDFSRTIFPLSHIFYASNISVLNMAPIAFTRTYPTILASLMVLCVYTVSRRVWKPAAVLAPVAFLSLNWYMEYHMARQAYGLLIWVIMMLIMYLYLETRDLKLVPLCVLVLLCIIPAHPGMIIITTFNLSLLAALTCYCLLRKRSWYYIKPSIVFPATFLVIMITAYYMLPDIRLYLTSIYEGVTGGGFQGFSMGGPASARADYAAVNRLRMLMGVSQSALAFIVLILYSRQRLGRTVFFAAWFIGCYLWLGYSLTHNGYLIERAFLTAVVPASVLIPLLFKPGLIKNISLRRYLTISVALLMVFFLLTIPITKNSVDAFETPSIHVYHAGRFAQETASGRVRIMDTHEGIFRYLEATDDSTVRFRSGRSGVRDDFELGKTFGYHLPSTTNFRVNYLLFTDYFNNYILIRYDNATAVEDIHNYEMEYAIISNRVYDAGSSRMYSRI